MHLIIINNLLNLNLLVYLVGEDIVTSLSKKEQMEGLICEILVHYEHLYSLYIDKHVLHLSLSLSLSLCIHIYIIIYYCMIN